MDTTDYGYDYELSWDFRRQEDVIYLDLGDHELYFTKADLHMMLEVIGEE